MPIADMVIQTFVIVVCLIAVYRKWGIPLVTYIRAQCRPTPPPEARLLTEAYLQQVKAQVAATVSVPTSAAQPVEDPDEEETDDDDDESETEVDEDGDGTSAEDEDESDEDEEDEVEETTALTGLGQGAGGRSRNVVRPVHLQTVGDDEHRVENVQKGLWQTWMVRVMHGAIHLIAIGETGAGKTTVLQSFVEYLVAQGIPVVVCDPDAAAGDWPGTEIHGGGDDFKDITATLKAIQTEARTRRQARADGQRAFDPLWFVLDEYADIKDECPIAGVVVENLLRRARKLNIHLVIGVQDTQVRTMGFERRSALLRNARTVTIKLGPSGQRMASVDDEPPIRIPYLTPAQCIEDVRVSYTIPIVDDALPDPFDGVPSGSDNKDDQILVRLIEGQSYARIAAELHVTTTRISRVKKEHTFDMGWKGTGFPRPTSVIDDGD